MLEKRELGRSGLQLSPIGLGCWQFSKGENTAGRYWDSLEDTTMQEIIRISLNGGMNWFDTAEVYGSGASERVLASSLDAMDIGMEEAKIATKWWPMARKASSIEATIEARKDALNQRPIHLYQIHQPFSLSSVEQQMTSMARLHRTGKIGAVGVSNFSQKAMIESNEVLDTFDIPLASNQVKYSLLDRTIEKNGLLDAAKEHQIAVIAYSPLEQGLLTGKFHEDPSLIQQTAGPRKWMSKFRSSGLEKTEPLIQTLRYYAEKYDVTPSQIALNWMVQYHEGHVFVIPGASKPKHAEDNAGAMAFSLTREELLHISDESWKVQ
ncbi:aldo/keto reductase [Alkalicoccus chagannorensis]|uniref:aldo/keto reductase n=1 Tax=Alkalicoccus chagannorensis TaxID=427072 RepID=UPI00042897F9|nr:aldo/keto reductase [Alkalicoccus chagannorensis]